MDSRKIIHIDMDCFYAAVEEKFNPTLRGKPVAVGGPAQSRSVICTANYAARKYGVRSAMPSSMAARLCKDLILVPPNFSLYRQESQKVREILDRYTSVIEPLSLDEAYLDVSQSSHCQGSATLIALEIRKTIFNELGLRASAGVSNCKFLAKVASDWNKPNGQFVIAPHEIGEFVKDLPVEKLVGIGKVTSQHLRSHGVRVCGDIQALDLERRRKIFGRRADDILNLANGLDPRPLCTHWERKTLSVEETFPEDFGGLREVSDRLKKMYQDFCERMRKKSYIDRISGHVVKVRFADFSRTSLERKASHFPSFETFHAMLSEAMERKNMKFRLAGFGVRLGKGDSEPTSSAEIRAPAAYQQLQFSL